MHKGIGACCNGLGLEGFIVPVAWHLGSNDRCHVGLDRNLIDRKPVTAVANQLNRPVIKGIVDSDRCCSLGLADQVSPTDATDVDPSS